MNVFRHFRDQIAAVLAALAEAGVLPADSDFGRVTCEPPRDAAKATWATNAALVLAKAAGTKPRDLGKIAGVAGATASDSVSRCRPGVINIRSPTGCCRTGWPNPCRRPGYGDADIGRRPNVEFTSANPTGLLHIAHARGTVFGDALAACSRRPAMRFRNYYVNDWADRSISSRNLC